MEEAVRTQLHTLSEDIIDASEAVSRLVEAEIQTQEEIVAANGKVAEIAARYADLLGQLPEAERSQVDRAHGRRVTDLRRLASRLPQKANGQATRGAADKGFPFLLSREPPKSIEPQRHAPTHRPGEAPEFTVGREVESWCGTCGGLTEHAIVAMVGGQPKQVICNTCHARHGFRLTPARSKSQPAAAAPTRQEPPKPTREQLEAKRREEARFALQKELAEAKDVRVFQPKERYKAGEIVQHPEHGRGKIENVLRGSILVRFRDGLKSISTL